MNSTRRGWWVFAAILLAIAACFAIAPYVLCRCGGPEAPEHMPIPTLGEIDSVTLLLPGQDKVLSPQQAQEFAEILARSEVWRCHGWADFNRKPHLGSAGRFRVRHKGTGETVVDLTGTTMVGFRSSTTPTNRYSGTWYEVLPEENARLMQIRDALLK